MAKIALFGGSSPFTLQLINDLSTKAAGLGAAHLVLLGRNVKALTAISEYANRTLHPCWTVSWATDVSAIDDADVIISQIRFGGLIGREADERFAMKYGISADETLGPGGFRCALRIARSVREFASIIRDRNPKALVINLTNPLSLTTALMANEGLEKVYGVCELPIDTLSKVGRALGIPSCDLDWQYVGLNHRGFLFGLKAQGRSVIDSIVRELEKGVTLEGMDADTVGELRAVPLKYFSLHLEPQRTGLVGAGRAKEVHLLREDILNELSANPGRSPPSLNLRSMPWYRDAVVPILGALLSQEEVVTTLNVADGKGEIAREIKVKISRREVLEIRDNTPPSPGVTKWIDTYTTHEQNALRAVCSPSEANIREAVGSDPLVDEELVPAVSGALYRMVCSERANATFGNQVD